MAKRERGKRSEITIDEAHLDELRDLIQLLEPDIVSRLKLTWSKGQPKKLLNAALREDQLTLVYTLPEDPQTGAMALLQTDYGIVGVPINEPVQDASDEVLISCWLELLRAAMERNEAGSYDVRATYKVTVQLDEECDE